MSEQNEKLTAEDLALKIAAITNPTKVANAMAFGGRAENEVRTKYIPAAKYALEYTSKQVEHATAELREQLKEAEEDAKHKAEKWSEWDKMLCSERHTHEKETEKLRKEFEAASIRVNSTTNALIHIANSPFLDTSSVQAFAKKFISDIVPEAESAVSLQTQLAEAQRQRDESELKNESLHLTIDRKEQSIDDLNNNYQIIERQRDELKSALQEIKEPIKFMQARLKEDERLDGFYAIEMSKDHNYLKGIADKALSRLSSGETKPNE